VGGWRTSLARFAELLGLWALTGQAVLGALGDAPELALWYGADRRDLVVSAVVFLLVVPVAGWAVVALVGLRWPRAAASLQALLLAGLAGVFVVAATTAWPIGLRVALGVLGAALVFAGYRRTREMRTWLAVLAVAAPVFVALFVFGSPMGEALGAHGSDRIADVEVPEDPPPVVLLVLDEFPTASMLDDDGEIDAEHFPNLAALRHEATWYRNHTTVAEETVRALPALLTGRYVRTGSLPVWAQHPDNLFRLLAASHRLDVTEAMTQLCSPTLCAETTRGTSGAPARDLLGDMVDVLEARLGLSDADAQRAEQLDAFAERVITRVGTTAGTDRQPARMAGFLDGLRPTDEPTLHFLHLVLPHRPWRLYADGTAYDDQHDPPTWGQYDAWDRTVVHHRHLLQARYTDELVGAVVARMKATGLYDEALLVVVSDHGAAFVPGGDVRRITTPDSLPQILFSPLFVKLPGQREGGTSDENVQLIDVVPTIARAVGVQIPWPVDGEPIGERGPTKRYIRTALGDDRVTDETIGAARALRRLLALEPPSHDPPWSALPYARTEDGEPALGEIVAELSDQFLDAVVDVDVPPSSARPPFVAAVVDGDVVSVAPVVDEGARLFITRRDYGRTVDVEVRAVERSPSDVAMSSPR
jgi:hypothetical protein